MSESSREDLDEIHGARARESVASEVTQKSPDAAQALASEGREVAQAIADKSADMVDDAKDAAAQRSWGFAKAIRTAADEVEGSSPEIANHIRSAAASVEGISGALRDRSAGQVLSDVTDFARRQPVAFFGLAAVAGFAVARFGKSSTGRPSQPQQRATEFTPPPNAAPGWIPGPEGARPVPATMAAATLGGAVAHRGRQTASYASPDGQQEQPARAPDGATDMPQRANESSPVPNERSTSPL